MLYLHCHVHSLLCSCFLQYGIALDDRHPYTKTDWLMWIGALADKPLVSL